MPERRLSFILISTLLTLALGTLVIATAMSRTIGQSDQAKDLIDKSGLYQAIIPAQVADVQKANPSLANVPLDNPEIQKLLATSLDTQRLQQEGNKAVDAVYNWLEGKSDKPLIDITVLADQQALAKAAGDYTARYVEKLPVCTPEQTDYAAFSADPLSATCLPPGTSPDMVRSSIENSIATNPALGTSTQLTEEDVKLTNGKTIMDSFNTAPTWYQRAQLLPFIALVTAGVCILLLLLILKPARGIKSSGKHLLSVGITLAVVAIALAWALEKLFSTILPKNENPNVGDALMRLTTLFNNALRDNMVIVSLYLVIAGAVLFALGYLLSRVHRTTTTKPVINRTDTLAAAPPKASFVPLPTKAPKTTQSKKSSTTKKKTTHKKKK